jgi:hypothetical protein
VFYVETQSGENHKMFFLICLEELHSLEAPTSFVFQLNWKEALQPPSFSGYNLREAPTPQFYGYNQKEATTPYVLRLWWLQPHVLAPSNHPEVEVE